MADGSTTTWKGGTEHWTKKGDVKLFLWNKKPAAGKPRLGTILFVHGSSMASQPTFDLYVPGRPDSSAMEYFAGLGYDTWTMDNEGYGRSDKSAAAEQRHLQRRRRSRGRQRVHPPADRREAAARLRHLLGRAQGRALRAAPSGARLAPRARRLRLDRRGQPHARRAQEEARAVQGDAPAPHRSRLRAQHLQSRPSGHRRRGHRRSLRRRHPVARRLDADGHLRRHVLEAAAGGPGEDPVPPRSSCAASGTASRASTT